MGAGPWLGAATGALTIVAAVVLARRDTHPVASSPTRADAAVDLPY